MIVYEYPLHERVRLYMRVDHMSKRLAELLTRQTALDHHFALQTLFEIVDICDSRTDLKSEILKELERYRQTTLAFRGYAGVDERVMDALLERIGHCYSHLSAQMGKLSHEFNSNEWLTSVRSRINIPAGTCEFDHPSYHAWAHSAVSQRQADLIAWTAPLQPILSSVTLIMQLLRDTGMPQKVMAQGGIYQQSLTQTKPYQLLRLMIEPSMQLVPEISGNRLMVTVRLMRKEGDKLLHAGNVQAGFELALCA